MPIQKKKQQMFENYRPISVLPICGKIFFIKNGLISKNQLGFKAGDFCVNQFLSISHEIYKSFGDEFDVRCAFLDTSKAFDEI